MFPKRFDALITSPPYMNALDYGRDNRLRLWFIDPALTQAGDNDAATRRKAFVEAMTCLATKVEAGLRPGGYCVLVVGEEFKRSFEAHPSEVVLTVVHLNRIKAPSNKRSELSIPLLLDLTVGDLLRPRHDLQARARCKALLRGGGHGFLQQPGREGGEQSFAIDRIRE